MAKYRTRPVPPPLAVRELAPLPVHTDRRIIITGAAGYLGRETARLLGAQGATVVISDVNAEAIVRIIENLDQNGRFHPLVMDVGDEQSVSTGIAEAIRLMDGVDALVNCAAIAPHCDPLSVPRSQWEHVMAVNVYGAYEAACLVARHLCDAGRRGGIVNVSSEAGKRGHIDSLAYSASKAALLSMTRMLSETLAPHDINVNAVCPGGLDTPMLHQVAEAYSNVTGDPPADIFRQMANEQLGRHPQPQEVAQVISFLLTDAAVLIRGQAINVDAGDTVG